jgi:hypothetical protein
VAVWADSIALEGSLAPTAREPFVQLGVRGPGPKRFVLPRIASECRNEVMVKNTASGERTNGQYGAAPLAGPDTSQKQSGGSRPTIRTIGA